MKWSAQTSTFLIFSNFELCWIWTWSLKPTNTWPSLAKAASTSGLGGCCWSISLLKVSGSLWKPENISWQSEDLFPPRDASEAFRAFLLGKLWQSNCWTCQKCWLSSGFRPQWLQCHVQEWYVYTPIVWMFPGLLKSLPYYFCPLWYIPKWVVIYPFSVHSFAPLPKEDTLYCQFSESTPYSFIAFPVEIPKCNIWASITTRNLLNYSP